MKDAYRFTIDGYRKIIAAFLREGYRPRTFGDFVAEPGALLVRHDIDISLACAVRQAEVNAELGVSATFFLLLTSEQYNLASAAGRSALEKIGAAGQRIGLHFDASLYGDDINALQREAMRECEILRHYSPVAVEAISFHRPVKALQGLAGNFAGLAHAYEPRFFSEVEYCSDSRGRFHHGGPFERKAFSDGAPFQFLTHPIWWMREEELSPVDSLLSFRKMRDAELAQNLAANCEPFARHLEEANV